MAAAPPANMWRFKTAERVWNFVMNSPRPVGGEFIYDFVMSHCALWALTHETQTIRRQPIQLYIPEAISGTEPLTYLQYKLPNIDDNKLSYSNGSWFRGPADESQPINSLFIFINSLPHKRLEYVLTDFLFMPFTNARVEFVNNSFMIHVDDFVITFTIGSPYITAVEKEKHNSQASAIGGYIIGYSDDDQATLTAPSIYEGFGFMVEPIPEKNTLMLYTPTTKEELSVFQNRVYGRNGL